jgi:outer membrane protein OmpA-like peptidoglycan-associated protein
VGSEKEVLNKLAKNFENYQQYDRHAQLMIVAHADVRASRAYNQALSERRAGLIRDYLVSQGVSSNQIRTQAVGKDQQMDIKKVEALQSQDPEKPEKWETRRLRTTWLAYNRRADVILEPEGQTSDVAYPNDVADARILWELRRPNLKAVMTASAAQPSTEQASVGHPGN